MFTLGLIGATNVGKSTLFNRIIGQYRAIVTNIHGTTKDILHHHIQTDAGMVEVMDSPGLDTFDEERPMLRHIISQSDLIFFVIDSRVGLTAKERTINEYLMQNGLAKKSVLVVNKLEGKLYGDEYELAIADYYALGYTEVIGVSAKEGDNIDTLKDIMQLRLLSAPQEVQDATVNKGTPIAILGKPNSGKSTLLNTLAHSDIAKVEDKPGTTLDYNMFDITRGTQHFTLFDTAGLRRKIQMEDLESIAYSKTRRMLKYIRPLVVYLVDVTKGLSHRDKTIIDEVERLILPMVICLNKTDTITKAETDFKIKELVRDLPHLRFVPILPLSGKEGLGLEPLLRFINDVWTESHKQVTTGELNRLFRKALITRPPRFPKNRVCKIMYVTQTEFHPPKFTLFVSHKDRITSAFRQWVENTFRREYGFIGTSIMLDFRQREKKKQHSEHPTQAEYGEYEHNDEEFEKILAKDAEKNDDIDNQFDDINDVDENTDDNTPETTQM